MKRIALILALLVSVPAHACQKEVRAYNAAATIDFCLWETDGTDLKTDAAAADGDVTIYKDEGAPANIAASTEFTDEGQCYSLALTATETQAARIHIVIQDQSTKAFLDKCIIVETFGNASAQFPTADANVVTIEGTDATDALASGANPTTVLTGTAQAGGARTITLAAGAPSTNNIHKNNLVVTTGGTGPKQTRRITSYNGTTKVATVNRAWDVTPDNTTTYAIIAADVATSELEPK